MPYEKTPSETNTDRGDPNPSFEMIYTGFRSNYNANVGPMASGFSILKTDVIGEAVFSKMVVGAECNRIVWDFNTTSSAGSTATETNRYAAAAFGTTPTGMDVLPGITTMSFYQADGTTLIGSVTSSGAEGWQSVGGGTANRGFIQNPPPLIQFTVSASHNMVGNVKAVNNAVGDFGSTSRAPFM